MPAPNQDTSGQWLWSRTLPAGLAVGVLFLLLFTLSRESWARSLAIVLMIAAASAAVGILAGFLFGIPRTLSREAGKPDVAGEHGPVGSEYGVNTNLEQISDWLTKIIVGVGLVQLTILPSKFQELADYLASAFDGEPVSGAVIGTIITYFGIGAFLLGYLATRLYLASEFSRAEQAARERPEYYEGLIHAFLYQPKPEGFRNAIRHGEEYNRRFGPNSERVWTYLACAYAQEYEFLRRAPEPDENALAASRQKAIEAIRRVLQLKPEAKDSLRDLWDPALVRETENDLAVFYEDEEFKKLLGQPPQ